eukprot:Awhi_evm1s15443
MSAILTKLQISKVKKGDIESLNIRCVICGAQNARNNEDRYVCFQLCDCEEEVHRQRSEFTKQKEEQSDRELNHKQTNEKPILMFKSANSTREKIMLPSGTSTTDVKNTPLNISTATSNSSKINHFFHQLCVTERL